MFFYNKNNFIITKKGINYLIILALNDLKILNLPSSCSPTLPNLNGTINYLKTTVNKHFSFNICFY